MALLLPGESEHRPRWIEVVIAVAAVVGLCAMGCASPSRSRRVSSVFKAAQQTSTSSRAAANRRRPPVPHTNRDEGASVVAANLHKAGLRFGTDGSTRALWGYLSTTHKVVALPNARPGDFVFFDTRGRASDVPECADHVGVIEAVDPGGRIAFRESRGGQTRVSYVYPAMPLARRDDQGTVLNTFLRPKKIDDPPDSRYFAGEMLCGIARAKAR